MDQRRAAPADGLGPYASLRLQVDDACGRIAPTRTAAETARSALMETRRALGRVQRTMDEARADLDPARMAQAKADAHATYRAATHHLNDEAAELQRATVEWMAEIDRLNRETRRAGQRLSRAESEVQRLTTAVAHQQREADATRIAAESAVAACAEARQALATVDAAAEPAMASIHVPGSHGLDLPSDGWNAGPPEGSATIPAPMPFGSEPPPHDEPSDGDAETDPRPHRPVLVERMVEGDRDAQRAVAQEIAHVTGQPVTQYLLLLHELIESLNQVAVDSHCLAFDESHPLWSQFDQGERLAIVTTLADLGFHFDPEEGWFGGRAPTANDLVMALAYSGRDPRSLRRLPTPDELRSLPGSVRVVTLELLANRAPDLALSQMLELLGSRAEMFGQLWDDWGRIRPLLLSEADAVAA